MFVGMTVEHRTHTNAGRWHWRERIDAQNEHVHVPPKIPYARSSCGEIWFRGRELWIGKEPGDCLIAKWAKDNLLWVNPVIEHFSQMAGRHLLRESKWAHAYRRDDYGPRQRRVFDHVIVMTPRIPNAASHKFNLNWLLEKVMDPAILRGHDRSANMYMRFGKQRLADLQSYARRFNLAIPRQDELDAYTDKCKTKEILGKMTT